MVNQFTARIKIIIAFLNIEAIRGEFYFSLQLAVGIKILSTDQPEIEGINFGGVNTILGKLYGL